MNAPKTSQRLKTWKEIADYIHRDARTAKRYEAERGLPIHRMPGGGKSVVFAYTHEIDDWLHGLELQPVELRPAELQHDELRIEAAQDAHPTHGKTQWPFARATVLAGFAGLVLIAALTTWSIRAQRPASNQAAEGSSNPRAESLYLSGRFAWNRRTAADLRRAVTDFDAAATLDPSFAAAYVGLADSYNLMPEFGGLEPVEAYPKARAAAAKAVRLAPHSAAAHRALAFTLLYWYRDLTGSDREFQASLALDPRSAQTRHWHANALAARGDYKAALAEIRRAEALDPTNPAIKADEGWVLYMNGLYSEAIRVLQEVETVQPDYPLAYLYAANVYDVLGRPAGMLDQWRRAAALSGDRRLRALTEAGQSALARGPGAVLESITAEAERRYAAGEGSPYALATYEMRLGRRDRALTYLEACIERHDPAAVSIPSTAIFEPLKGSPRFQRIVLMARTSA